jgi:N-acyl-D-aspartate/D-glutamate deacylase
MEAARAPAAGGRDLSQHSEEDMRRILAHPATMIGSDGLPCDPRPHPRLWGTFPRVLGRYCREEQLMSLPQAVHKMTGLPAQRFGLTGRGLIREGYCADLVLFDAENSMIRQRSPIRSARQQGLRRLGEWCSVLYEPRGQREIARGVLLNAGGLTWMQ